MKSSPGSWTGRSPSLFSSAWSGAAVDSPEATAETKRRRVNMCCNQFAVVYIHVETHVQATQMERKFQVWSIILELLLLLVDLSAGIHGKRAVKLTGKGPLSKPLHGCVQKTHVLVFPHQIMRSARDMNEHLLWYRYKVT